MNRILLFLLLLMVFPLLSLQAQVSYMQSVGGSYLLGVVNQSSSSESVGVPGLTFNPRLNLEFSEDFSFSATSYPTLGGTGFLNSRSNNKPLLGFDLPILAQFNCGQHATPESETPVGVYGAAGWGFSLITGGDQVIPQYGGLLLGPTAEMGIKFLVVDYSVGVRIKYMADIVQEDTAHLIGVSLLYNLNP